MKVKIIKIDQSNYGFYNDDEKVFLYPNTLEWEEVSEEEYQELTQAVFQANLMVKNGRYIVISYDDSYVEDVYQKASEFIEAEKKKAQAKKEAAEKAKADREKKKKEREIKKLKALQEKYGDEV